MSLIWRSFARRLVQKKGKRKCEETYAPPAKRHKNMSVEACIARKVLHILEPSLDEEQRKKEQLNEINERKSPERAEFELGDQFYQCYLIMKFDDVTKPVKMVFACKDFAIVTEIMGQINMYMPRLRKISLGSQWDAKFVEWVDENWERKGSNRYGFGGRSYNREDLIEADLSSNMFSEYDELFRLFL